MAPSGQARHVAALAAIAAGGASAAALCIWTYGHKDLVARAIRRLERMGWLGPRQKEKKWSLPPSGMPECHPLCTVDELLSWTPKDITDLPGGKLTRTVPSSLPIGPRVLMCHDMKGGYQGDRFVQGSTDATDFRFYHWGSIDVFVYFSHHMVTIPPAGWITAAHRHNTLMLGTFITEWDLGRRQCERMWATKASAEKAAHQLARIAQHHGFDGWLINIENTLSPSLIPNVLHFLTHLREKMRSLCGPHAHLIWYDALTTEGKLVWQNSVTSLNQPFFDVCDAIFINYGWKSETPSQICACVCEDRRVDVYMGVDVWGRGTYGGGQDNSYVGVEAALAQGLSAALFAPGWLHEAFPRDGFAQRNDTWWTRTCSAHVAHNQPSKQHTTSTATDGAQEQSPLCFSSTFCKGYGPQGTWIKGVQVSALSWHNLGLQALQPSPHAMPLPTHNTQRPPATAPTTAPTIPPATAESSAATAAAAAAVITVMRASDTCALNESAWRFSGYERLAFSGGTCLLLSGPRGGHAGALGQPLLWRLFDTGHMAPSSGQGLRVCFTYAHLLPNAGAHAGPPEAPYSHLAVVLWIRSPPTTPPTTHSVLALLPNRSPHPRENGTAAACPEYARPLVSAGMQVSCCLSTRDTLASVHLPSEAGAGPQGVFWESDTFTVPGVCVPEGSVVEGVGVVCWRARDLSQEASSVDEGATEQWLLGHMAVHDTPPPSHAAEQPTSPNTLQPSITSARTLAPSQPALQLALCANTVIECDLAWPPHKERAGEGRDQGNHAMPVWHVWARAVPAAAQHEPSVTLECPLPRAMESKGPVEGGKVGGGGEGPRVLGRKGGPFTESDIAAAGDALASTAAEGVQPFDSPGEPGHPQAYGAEPVRLRVPSKGQWTWLGAAYVPAYRARVALHTDAASVVDVLFTVTGEDGAGLPCFPADGCEKDSAVVRLRTLV